MVAVAGPPDAHVLEALLHDAERIIDHQIRAIEELDDKSEHMIGLGVALLAGGLSLATFTVSEGSLDPGPFFLGGMVVAGAANLVALGSFLVSYIGFPRDSEAGTGPSLDWIHSKSCDRDWTYQSHLLSLLSANGYPAYSRVNLGRIEHSMRARRNGLLALAVAVPLYTVASAQILVKAMRVMP